MNALPEVITLLFLQILSADCAVCKIGNDVRFSKPVLSEWSLNTDSPTHCTEIKLGGVTVHSKSPKIPEQPLLVQLSKAHFSSGNGYICQTLRQIQTGYLSSKKISNFNESIQPTIKPSHKEASSFIISSSSLNFTSSMPTKHSSFNMPSTKYSFSTKGFTNSPSLKSLFSSESSTTSSFSTSSLSQDATLDATHTSLNLIPSTASTLTNNLVMSSTAEATEGSSSTVIPCPHRFEATGEGVSCYQLIYDQLIFTNASNYCKDIQPNAHLVTFENQAEEEWVVHVIKNMTNTSGQDYWIGLKNAVYTWEDGSYLSYANFGDKYTDNEGECLFTDVSKDSTWKGGKCTDEKEILCEFEATGNTSSCSMTYDNSCYEIQTTGERAQASQICENIDKYVVQIETADEQLYLNNVLSNDVWIGLLKNESATYVWEAKTNTAAEFFNFGSGNNVIPLPYGGICHRIKQDDSYSWNEDRCDTEHSFICEWSLD